MISNISAREPRRMVERVTFGTLVLLTMLALMAALAGTNNVSFGISSAQAQLPKSTAVDKSKAAPATGDRIAIAAIRDNQGLPDIYTMDSNGNDVMQLTSNPGNYTPAWSPDGSQIAFYGNHTGAIGIYVMTANGGNQHMIGPPGASDPTWSPDGTKIAFRSQDNEIYVMNSDGTGTPTPLTTDHTVNLWPSWSPDGTKIAFVNVLRDGDPDDEIYVMNSNGSNQHVIDNPPSGSGDAFPAWSPDGSRIAFTSSDATGSSAVYAMDATGGNISQITAVLYGQSNPTWSPDGLRIAFQRAEAFATDPTLNPTGGTNHIYVIDVTGANEHSISGGSPQDYQPDWQHNAAKVVLVQNEEGTPVPDAQVYTNTQGPGFPSTLVGTTNMSGTLVLPNPVQDEYVIARSLVYTGTTEKGSHDGWAYHVWLTNIGENSDGSQTAYVITDTSQLTQTVTISSTAPLIGFNIVASVEYNATPDNLSTIATGLSGKDKPDGTRFYGASDYLLDVTDGQMFFEKVTLYENQERWVDADYQFFAYHPRGSADVNSLTGTSGQINVHGPNHYGDPWDQVTAYSSLIHEFTHYAIGAYDEYFYQQDGDGATCSLDTEPPYDSRASIMSDQSLSSEYCTDDNHNPLTVQGVINGQSVWRTLQDKWDDTMGRWTIVSPIDRGYVDPGPYFYICPECVEAVPQVVSVAASSCAPIVVTVTMDGSPVAGAEVRLKRSTYDYLAEGSTNTSGKALVYGAEVGSHTVWASVVGPDHWTLYRGHVDVSSCSAITIPVSINLGQTNQPETQWPIHWLTGTPDFSQDQVHLVLHFAADPPSQPALYGSQGGSGSQQITLTYDPVGHTYIGDYPFDPSLSLNFQFDVGLTDAQGEEFFPHTFDAAQFRTSGPRTGGKAASAVVPALTDTWDVFPPETMVNLSVNANSMPDGTGVMGGNVILPAAPPNDLLAVGGPYSVQGENPISGTAYLSLEFQSEYFCGLQAGSTRVYQYNGTGWDPLTTSLNEEWHLAAAPITEWGIYAVFAQPNPQVVFSDVPQGSTFYTYINWITCHGIASGYTDGTFRPNNNATRGQISKMVALAFRWRLEAPSGGNYTFTDVPPGSTFFLYIEAAYREGVVSGYPCGGAGEPCDAQQRPYFRPNNNVTRGQIAKIISNAARYTDAPTGQTFEDVLAGSTFFDYIERIASRGIINGYPCGGAGEPCGGGNLPYFRPNNNATRGQLSKIIYLTLAPR